MVVILLLGLVEPRKTIFITRSVHWGVSLENRIPIKLNLDMSVQFSELYQVFVFVFARNRDCSSLIHLIIASLYSVVKSFSMNDTTCIIQEFLCFKS